MSPQNAQETILARLRGALERWCKGDTFGYADLFARDATYFDPRTETRIERSAAVQDHFRQYYEGKINVPKFEMPNPKFQLHGTIAVLTYNWYPISGDGERLSGWNATEVWQNSDDQWKIIHGHWSLVQPK